MWGRGYYIERFRELPLGTALKKAVLKALKIIAVKLEELKARFSLQCISDRELLQSLEAFTTLEEVRCAIRGNRPPFLVQVSAKKELVTLIQKKFPRLMKEIVEEAERVCNHTFDILGSGLMSLDEFIELHGGKEVCGYLPWHFDFKTGFRWNPRKFYKQIQPAYGRADIKVPWELSRFQHVAVLGQAYWLTGDEKYVREFVRQVDDWIDRNPPRFGVNWACTMDVAIRVANWILGFYFFKDSQALEDGFLIKFLKNLLIHGRHIMANLENKGITNNHYLADLVGLIYLGIAFPEFKESRDWRAFGLRELVKEMEKQVYDDGMDFEASTCYHRLALELFFYPALLCRLNSIELPQMFAEKLKKMFDFVLYVLKPNGLMPQIGDNDNGRLHVLKKRDILDMTYFLTFAALYYNDLVYKIEEFGFAPEAVWLFGPEALERWNKLPERSIEELKSRAFTDGGIFVMRHKRDYMVISCGPNGQGGLGGHAHNDKLSFELCLDGEDIIVDPGTFAYTGDPKWRNRFRSTAYHNTLTVGSGEQNKLPTSLAGLFRLDNRNSCSAKRFVCEPTKDVFEGEQNGFIIGDNKKIKAIHRRSILFDKKERYWLIRDFFISNASGSSRLILGFHVAPFTKVVHQGHNVILKRGKTAVVLRIDRDVSFEITDVYYSNQYGLKEQTQRINFSTHLADHDNQFLVFKVEIRINSH